MSRICTITSFFLCLHAGVGYGQATLEVGSQAPEIRLATPLGDTLSLSSLRGKLVLIDFWASWCGPCVAEQPHLSSLYSTYKNAMFSTGNGFEIYGVSFDSKKAAWLKQIEKNKINWVQVSDLKFWSSPVAKTYHLEEIPFNLLIDGRGVILAKNLHGEDLENRIKQYKKF